jgi:hypothetical protein
MEGIRRCQCPQGKLVLEIDTQQIIKRTIRAKWNYWGLLCGLTQSLFLNRCYITVYAYVRQMAPLASATDARLVELRSV